MDLSSSDIYLKLFGSTPLTQDAIVTTRIVYIYFWKGILKTTSIKKNTIAAWVGGRPNINHFFFVNIMCARGRYMIKPVVCLSNIFYQTCVMWKAWFGGLEVVDTSKCYLMSNSWYVSWCKESPLSVKLVVQKPQNATDFTESSDWSFVDWSSTSTQNHPGKHGDEPLKNCWRYVS